MKCRIVRECTCEEQVRSYHTDVPISRKTCNKIKKLSGVSELHSPSIYEICVILGLAFDWDSYYIDEGIIQILEENFISKMKLDQGDELEIEIETFEAVNELGELTLLTFCPLSHCLEFLHQQEID